MLRTFCAIIWVSLFLGGAAVEWCSFEELGGESKMLLKWKDKIQLNEKNKTDFNVICQNSRGVKKPEKLRNQKESPLYSYSISVLTQYNSYSIGIALCLTQGNSSRIMYAPFNFLQLLKWLCKTQNWATYL